MLNRLWSGSKETRVVGNVDEGDSYEELRVERSSPGKAVLLPPGVCRALALMVSEKLYLHVAVAHGIFALSFVKRG